MPGRTPGLAPVGRFGADPFFLTQESKLMPTLLANNIMLYYEVAGQGQTLAFIHGLGSSTRDWEFQIPAFSKKYQVVTFDLRGHGQSAKPEGPYTIEMFTDDLASLLTGLQVKSAHLVGISLGGAIALQFALTYPAMVKTLTIVNSGPSLGGTPEQAQQEIERRVGIVKQFGMRAMGQNLGPNLFPEAEQAALRQAFIERWAENDPNAYIEATRSMLGWDVTGQLGTLHCPTLIVASDKDYTPVAAKKAYAELMPNAQLTVMANAHHAVPLERPQEFNAVLAQFLARFD
jgi:3-oxoadipate enol-lactonase